MTVDTEPGTATVSPARLIRSGLVLCIAACCLSAQQAAPQQYTITPGVRAILDHVSADSLRGHLSFIASDALEGRNTPSRGLDIAAEYIAAQFRRAGLEPAGDDGYFQTANWMYSQRDMTAFTMSIEANGQSVTVEANQVTFTLNHALSVSAGELI